MQIDQLIQSPLTIRKNIPESNFSVSLYKNDILKPSDNFLRIPAFREDEIDTNTDAKIRNETQDDYQQFMERVSGQYMQLKGEFCFDKLHVQEMSNESTQCSSHTAPTLEETFGCDLTLCSSNVPEEMSIDPCVQNEDMDPQSAKEKVQNELNFQDTDLKTRAESNDSLSVSAPQTSCEVSDFYPVLRTVQKKSKKPVKQHRAAPVNTQNKKAIPGPKKQIKKVTKQTEESGARKQHVEKRSYFRTAKDVWGQHAQKAGKGLDCDEFVCKLRIQLGKLYNLDSILNNPNYKKYSEKIVSKMIVLTHTNSWPSIQAGKATVDQNKILKKALELAGEELDFETPRRVMYRWSKDAQREFFADPISNFFFQKFLNSDGFEPAMRDSVRRSQGEEAVVLGQLLEHKESMLQEAKDALNDIASSNQKTDARELAILFNKILEAQ